MSNRQYEGSELELFKHAVHWKRYLFKTLSPWLQAERMLEVGSGIGGNVEYYAEWAKDIVLLEPDAELLQQSQRACEALPHDLRFINGTTRSLQPDAIGSGFDVILYADVLEHIEDSSGEIQQAASMLRSGGRLVIVVPAYPRLFSEFDAEIGHFRRYTKSMLLQEFQEGFPEGIVKNLRHIEAAGVFASFLNKMMLKQSKPTKRQVAVWDNYMVPVSRYGLDPLFQGRLGKSLIGVIQKP